MRRLGAVWCAGLIFAMGAAAAAEDDPSKPVRIIVSISRGALNDMGGRAVATAFSERLGKQFIVENRTGTGGTDGSEVAAHAPADKWERVVKEGTIKGE